MLNFSTVSHIHRLSHQGLSMRKTATALDVSRESVAKYLRDPFPVRFRAKRKSILDQYRDDIVRMLRIAPNSSAEIIHCQLTELGFRGGITIVRNLLQNIRGEWRIKPYLGDVGHYWMLRLLQGMITCNELEDTLKGQLNAEDISVLHEAIINKPLRYRNRSIAVLSYLNDVSHRSIARFLLITRSTVGQYILQFKAGGVKELFNFTRKEPKKCEEPQYVKELFRVLHAPPMTYDVNRTTWKMDDLHRVMKDTGLPLCKDNIRKIVRNAGYKYRKAKTVLTSNDPEYRNKIDRIHSILSSLGPRERFFSIDEFGPLAIRMRGGRLLVPPGQIKTIPQWQKSKGTLILTGALELSANQITHFYSETKDTSQMIKLLNVLIEKYSDEKCIYLSWDAASWHASKELQETVDSVNSMSVSGRRSTPKVLLAPLPTRAQFLNVIESVFSGLARAIIHNSDYQSVAECKYAIDRYFSERNNKYLKNPKRAGKKIWGKEIVRAVFDESNNCKDPKFR